MKIGEFQRLFNRLLIKTIFYSARLAPGCAPQSHQMCNGERPGWLLLLRQITEKTCANLWSNPLNSLCFFLGQLQADLSRLHRQQTTQRTQQRTFSCTIRPNQSYKLTRAQFQMNSLQDRCFAKHQMQVFCTQPACARFWIFNR